jgi:hypothetical protein
MVKVSAWLTKMQQANTEYIYKSLSGLTDVYIRDWGHRILIHNNEQDQNLKIHTVIDLSEQ